MEKYAIVDTSMLPIVWVSFTGASATDQNFSEYLNSVRQCYDSQKTLAIIFDATNASLPSFRHQQMQANWLKENDQLMKSYCKGTAYIIQQSAVRAILKMIFALQSQPVPYLICKNKKEAEDWATQQLAVQ